MGQKTCAVYILTNPNRTVLYTGVTSDLPKRIWEHKNHLDPDGFSARYNTTVLVWYETTSDIRGAIALEKRIKAGSRAKKVERIEVMNPSWKDLSEDWQSDGGDCFGLRPRSDVMIKGAIARPLACPEGRRRGKARGD